MRSNYKLTLGVMWPWEGERNSRVLYRLWSSIVARHWRENLHDCIMGTHQIDCTVHGIKGTNHDPCNCLTAFWFICPLQEWKNLFFHLPERGRLPVPLALFIHLGLDSFFNLGDLRCILPLYTASDFTRKFKSVFTIPFCSGHTNSLKRIMVTPVISTWRRWSVSEALRSSWSLEGLSFSTNLQ